MIMCMTKNVPFKDKISILVTTILLLASVQMALAEHIFPAPREIKIAGESVVISDSSDTFAAIYVDGTNATMMAGVDLLNDRIVALGGEKLPVRSLSDESNKREVLKIFLVTASDAVSQDIIKRFGVKVQSDNPGPQGYVIAYNQKGAGDEVLVAGSDYNGAMYGCVTLGHFIEASKGNVVITPHNVRDWPDVLYRCMVEANEARKLYGRYDKLVRERKVEEAEEAGKDFDVGFKKFIDWLCWNKINRMAPFVPSMRRIDQVERMNRWTAYMEARGISLIWCRSPHVGSAKENRRGCVKRGTTEYCWSDDAWHLKEARKTADKVKNLRIKHFMLHMIDHDGADPEMWSQRCAACKEKFGDDRAAADCHVLMFYYNAIKDVYPECQIEFIPVPYKAWPFYQQGSLELSTEWLDGNPEAREKMRMSNAAIKYFKKVDKLLPNDVYITLREHGREPSKKYKQIFGNRPLTIWYWQFPARGWQTFFHNMGRYAKTWDFGDSRDMLFETSNDRPITSDIIALFNNEYAWNMNAPGAAVMAEAYDYSIGPELLDPTDVTYPFIDQACKQLYGSCGEPVAEVCKLDLSPMFIARPHTARVINAESHNVLTNAANRLVDLLPMMKYQAEVGSKAVDACNDYFESGPVLTGSAISDVPVIYRNVLAARDVAQMRTLKWECERELLNHNYRKVNTLASKGLKYLKNREHDFSRMNKQLAEYPEVEMVPKTVESELANFDFSAFEDSFSLMSNLAQNPSMLLNPELSIVTDSGVGKSISCLSAFHLPLEPVDGLMSYATTITAEKTKDGLNLVFRTQRGGSSIESVRGCKHDELLLKEPSAQQEYIGVYVRTESDKTRRVFLFNPKGSRLDARCVADKFDEAVLADWDPRWTYHVVRRPNLLQQVDMAWNPEWTVDISTSPRYWTAIVHLPWGTLGIDNGSDGELEKLGFVFDRYWRSSETFSPAEYGKLGSFDDGWIPIRHDKK